MPDPLIDPRDLGYAEVIRAALTRRARLVGRNSGSGPVRHIRGTRRATTPIPEPQVAAERPAPTGMPWQLSSAMTNLLNTFSRLGGQFQAHNPILPSVGDVELFTDTITIEAVPPELPSINVWGTASPSLATIGPWTYRVTGTGIHGGQYTIAPFTGTVAYGNGTTMFTTAAAITMSTAITAASIYRVDYDYGHGGLVDTIDGVPAAHAVANERRRAADERYRAEQQACEIVRVAARDRAQTLLRSLLSVEQIAELDRNNSITVIGSEGNRFRLRATHADGNITWLDDADMVLGQLCAHPRQHDLNGGYLPIADIIAGQVLALRHNERGLIAIANQFDGGRPRYPALAAGGI